MFFPLRYFLTIFPDDLNNHDEAVIPENFPGDLLIDLQDDSNSLYRKYDNEINNAFYYFVTRILSAINASVNNFHGRKTLKLISEIFTTLDEALGLILLENEFHVWQEQSKPKEEQNEKNLKRKYVNCKSEKKIVGQVKENIDFIIFVSKLKS